MGIGDGEEDGVNVGDGKGKDEGKGLIEGNGKGSKKSKDGKLAAETVFKSTNIKNKMNIIARSLLIKKGRGSRRKPFKHTVKLKSIRSKWIKKRN